MMLYPTVQELTNDNVNRYKLVIATAKCARHITDKANAERELEERRRIDTDRYGKEPRYDADAINAEKPVSVAVKRLYDGEYHIVNN